MEKQKNHLLKSADIYPKGKVYYESFASKRKVRPMFFVNSLDDELGKKRLSVFREKHKKRNLPFAIHHKAYHYMDDINLIRTKYPFIKEGTDAFRKRPGAFGLAASFCHFLEIVSSSYNNDFVLWFEDDTIPGKDSKLFWSQYRQALQEIGEKEYSKDLFFFSRNSFCQECGETEKWVESTFYYGTGAVLFPPGVAKLLLELMQKQGIEDGIDVWLYFQTKLGHIRSWDWDGTACPENKSFCGIFKQRGVSECGKKRINSTMGIINE